jgi:hypothetical protein
MSDESDRFVRYEGPPLKSHRDMLLYWGTSLLHLGASGDLKQFHPPPRVEDQEQMVAVYPDLWPKMQQDPSFGALISWSVEWARCGLPRIDLGHVLCASLMATSMSPDAISDVVVPWRAFSILIPSGLLAADNAARVAEDITCAHALHENGRVRLIATASNLSAWSGAARPLVDLGEAGGAVADDSKFIATPFDDRDLRALQMIDRLFLGVCALLSSPDDQREIAKRFGKAKGSKRASAFPEAWTYKLKRDVTFDARAAVRDYVAGGGRSPTVQSQVRGHWRRQHYGADGTEVRWLHIEPYWRGPEAAPIAARDHRVKA